MILKIHDYEYALNPNTYLECYKIENKINKKIIVEEAVKVLVLVLAVVIILVAAIFSVKAIDRHNESIAVNNIRKEIIDGR